MKFRLPVDFDRSLNEVIASWKNDNTISRIWEKDASVWTSNDEAKWLGWLSIVDEEIASLEKYVELQQDIEFACFSDILLMGMGGSSLCPEVLAMTFGKANFHILDSTVPAQVMAVEEKLDLAKTLFIVASKSGSTLEPNCFKQYFFERLSSVVGPDNAGKQFIAITDPGSKMEQIARDDGFRHIFYGNPEIGGRFSALSAFGMTAAASMGLDVEGLLQNTLPMVNECKIADPSGNPAAMLGLIMGVCHADGRDKLTIFTSPDIEDLGAWLEQLVAESTGKKGVAIIPVDREPIQPAGEYGRDRVFAFLSMKGDTNFDTVFGAVADAGHPAVNIQLESIKHLGQEFFRWEFATAVAGSVMGINPFNQPDVESAKIEAKKITEKYEETGELPTESPFFEQEGFEFYTDEAQAAELTKGVENSASSVIAAHLDRIGPGDYFALLAYVEMNNENTKLLSRIREIVLLRHDAATCLGFGPRFLHSTGQAYKGGANNGVFLQITSDDLVDIPVPHQKYTFGVVKSAQARGDFQVLLDRGRRSLRIHLGADVTVGLKKLVALLG